MGPRYSCEKQVELEPMMGASTEAATSQRRCLEDMAGEVTGDSFMNLGRLEAAGESVLWRSTC